MIASKDEIKEVVTHAITEVLKEAGLIDGDVGDSVNAAATRLPTSNLSAAELRAEANRLDALQAAASELERLGVKIGANGKVDMIALNAALDKARLDPLARIEKKATLARAGLVD